MDTLANLQQKLSGAEDLKSVVRSMKAMAASNIGQYETAVSALGEYYKTIALGILAYFKQQPTSTLNKQPRISIQKENLHCCIVFGSDQGLVGQFNDTLADFVAAYLADFQGKKVIWVIGERMELKLADRGFNITQKFAVPSAIEAVTPLVGQLIQSSEERIENGDFQTCHVFHNRPKIGIGYTSVVQHLLPLDEKWEQHFMKLKWPTTLIPQIAGSSKNTLLALIHEFLFATLFKACAESLASENASRLVAMQRAEKNILELLDTLSHQYHQLRQGLIDEELFDVISGFEALKNKR